MLAHMIVTICDVRSINPLRTKYFNLLSEPLIKFSSTCSCESLRVEITHNGPI